ncbi:stress responsive alpha-beta barrel domain-containing protein [Frondihabitans sp. PAMC 28766]|uniref:Dabb family protein n=1 Tax=Frondihabitans sp. PAMC 28766 TaxID=1795630 RepID=UPI00078C68ED|nr:Dabb family protein [Frondihabitans sp. PAMC 28766]AMM21890.1 stress responsive alpha-beta barrel domain-containing protein [Frondihabitans sp. PAMC 28766]
MTVKHIVIWGLAATDETEKAEALATIESALTGLVGRVPSILSLTVGVNGAYPDENSDVAVVADFADYEGLEAYQTHPDHLEVAALIRTLVSSRAAIDYEY